MEHVCFFWNEPKRFAASKFIPVPIECGFNSKEVGQGLWLKPEKRAILYVSHQGLII